MPESEKRSAKSFLFDILHGVAIGIAFIIPGFSGGSVAAILGIYEKIVGAIADIFKNFKKSIITLMPIAIGMAVGILSLLYPLSMSLSRFPFPTVCLFVGLAIGGIPSVTDKIKGRIKFTNIIACLIPLLLALSLSFIPIGSDVDLFSLDLFGYITLFAIGIIGSAALVIPGISGSMLLLIFGYYNPIIRLATDHLLKFKDVGISILILGVTALGIAVGFFIISVIMKKLLLKYPRGTYFSIFGFIIGSLPTVYISTAKEAGYTLSTLPQSPIHLVACILMLALGFVGSFLLVKFANKRKEK